MRCEHKPILGEYTSSDVSNTPFTTTTQKNQKVVAKNL